MTDLIVNIFTGVITTILKGIITIVIQSSIRDGLASGLEAVNLMVCSFLGDCVDVNSKMSPYDPYSYMKVPLNFTNQLIIN